MRGLGRKAVVVAEGMGMKEGKVISWGL